MIGWIALAAAILAAPFVAEMLRPKVDAEMRKRAGGQYAPLSAGITHFEWLGPARGPVAVCVHGLTTPSVAWHPLAQDLVDLGFRVLVYDLYGRGLSDRPPGRQDAAFFLRQLEELLADQGDPDEITLLGYSMGGAIATAFAAQHPDRVRRLVLVAPAGLGLAAGARARFVRRVPLLGDWLMLAAWPRQHRRATEAERGLSPAVDEIVDRQQAELHRRGFVPAVLSSLRGMLAGNQEWEHRAIAGADVPVLAIWAREDAVIPLSAMGTLTQWNRAARQVVIDGAGHGLPYTHPREVGAAIRAEVAGE